MKKNIYISALVVLLTGFMMTSCDDFLEAENKTAGGQTADGYFGKDASSLLTSAYSSLKSIVFSTDLYSRGTDLYIHTRGKTSSEFDTYTFNAENNTIKSYYSNVYKTINYANGVISYAGEDSQYGYEARFLRNYGYYLLTQHFGSVPYITTYINSAETNYPRTPLSEVYSAVIADLTDLYNNSSLAAQSHEGRANKQAVAALLAKVYLAAGWDIDTQINDAARGTYTVGSTSNFAQAAAWAEKAIGGVSLSMSFQDKWSPFNEGNAEEIFSVQYDRAGYPGDATNAGHNMQGNFGGYYGNYDASGLKNVGSEDQQSEKSMYLFEPGDQRYEGTYMTTFYNCSKGSDGKATNWGEEGYFAYYNRSAADLSKMAIAKKYFPYWYSETEVETWISEHKSQLEDQVNPTKWANGDVRIALLALPKVITWVYSYDEKNGVVTLTKSSTTLSDYNAQTSNGVCVKKFDDANTIYTNQNNDFRDIVLLHVSDMYLVAAEAYLMAGQESQALAKVNDVRNRAGVAQLASFSSYEPQYTTSGSFTLNSLDVILDERARELYAEGYRWMDLRRTKQLVRYNVEFSEYVADAASMANGAGEYKWLRPIPANELSANTGMSNEDQNPGY